VIDRQEHLRHLRGLMRQFPVVVGILAHGSWKIASR